MRYHAIFDQNGGLIRIGTGPGGIEISEGEYNAFSDEIQRKTALVDKLYAGEISAEDIPAEWREEIQRRTAEHIEYFGPFDDSEIDGEELLTMIEEVL